MSEVEGQSEPKNKKNIPSSPETSESDIDGKGEASGTEIANNDIIPQEEVNIPGGIPPKTAIVGPAQWEQIMARFDTFEQSIQYTIKEEIKINTAGIQNQVKKINTKFKEIDRKVTANKAEIDNIN